MTKILLDTNVVLDVLLDRQPYADASAAVWTLVETGGAEGVLAAHAVTTIHYLLKKSVTARAGNAGRILASILQVFGVAPVDSAVLQEALQLAFSDFEDGVTVAAARRAGCEYIVTRDPKGFRGSTVQPLTPEGAALVLSRL